MNTQKWYQSKVALGAILAQIILVVGLFATADTVNVVQVIGAAIITVVDIIAIGNNPTNPVGWGANEKQ